MFLRCATTAVLLLGDMMLGDKGDDEVDACKGLSKFQIRIVPSAEKVANEFEGISSLSIEGQG